MAQRQHICVCDDETAIADLVGQLLEDSGYDVSVCYSGQHVLDLLDSHDFDLIMLDIMMPGMDGFRCCQEIRRKGSTPIIFLSAKDEEIDKVVGFELGADDYVTKPFKPRELVARVKARLRRAEVSDRTSDTSYRTGEITIDESTFSATLHNERLSLTPKEFAILLQLVKRHGQPVASTQLFETIWNEPADIQSNNTIMVHIRNLRKKLSLIDSSKEFITTVWGVGYKID